MEVRRIKERESQTEKRWKRGGRRVVKEEKWLVYGAVWHAAISSLNLQCGVMDCERRRGNKVMSMRTEDKLI